MAGSVSAARSMAATRPSEHRADAPDSLLAGHMRTAWTATARFSYVPAADPQSKEQRHQPHPAHILLGHRFGPGFAVRAHRRGSRFAWSLLTHSRSRSSRHSRIHVRRASIACSRMFGARSRDPDVVRGGSGANERPLPRRRVSAPRDAKVGMSSARTLKRRCWSECVSSMAQTRPAANPAPTVLRTRAENQPQNVGRCRRRARCAARLRGCVAPRCRTRRRTARPTPATAPDAGKAAEQHHHETSAGKRLRHQLLEWGDLIHGHRRIEIAKNGAYARDQR